MAIKVQDGLFTIGSVEMTPLARQRAAWLQMKHGRKGDEALMVHAGVLIKLHATGQHGDLPASDRTLNRNNITKNSGRVLSVIGNDMPFVIITDLPEGKTIISTPEEV